MKRPRPKPVYRFEHPKCKHVWSFEKTLLGTRRTCTKCKVEITEIGKLMSPSVKGKDSMTSFNRGMS